jgi:hypothetical protein
MVELYLQTETTLGGKEYVLQKSIFFTTGCKPRCLRWCSGFNNSFSRSRRLKVKIKLFFMFIAVVFWFSSDSTWAELNINDGILFYTGMGKNLYRSNLDGSNEEIIYTVGYGTLNELEVDLTTEKIYWVESSGNKLMRSDFNGSNMEFVTGSVGLGYVISQDKIYYTSASKIMCCNKDGSNKETILSGIEYPVSIDLDPFNGKLYWGARKSGNQWLSRCNLDGSNIEVLVEDIYYHTGGLALDISNEKIYWAGYNSDGSWIRRANLDGSDIQDVISTSINSNVQQAKHLERDGVTGKLYWTDQYGSGKVQCCNSDGTDYMILVSGNAPYGVAVAHTTATLIDIKPGNCPNPLNVRSKGVVSVAILGSDVVDANAIVATSIRLAGVAAVRDSLEDVAGPVKDPNECACTTGGADGFIDLTLKFMTQDIVATLDEVNHGDVLELQLDGVLYDETPIEGADCVVISGKHKPINKADINKDGVVNMADVVMVADNWLESSVVED